MSRQRFVLRIVPRPLERLTLAEKRIKDVEPRDFRAEPWLTGEDVTFWTVERMAALKADNERLRRERKK